MAFTQTGQKQELKQTKTLLGVNIFLALLPLGLFLARVRSATMANLTLAVLNGQFYLTVSIEYGHRGLPRHASTLVWVGIAIAPG